MASIKMAYVNIYQSRNREFGYYRRDGQRIRIRGEIGSPEFFAHYETIHQSFERGQPVEKSIRPGSMDELIMRYKGSADFAQLAPRTKKEYQRFLDLISRLAGGMPVATMPRKFVLKLREDRKSVV